MKLFRLYLITGFILCFCGSCKRIKVEANTLPQGYSVAQVIGAWKITAIESDKLYDWDGDGDRERDIYTTWQDCKRDNRFEFFQGYTANFKTTCNDSKSGQWKLEGIVLEFIPEGSFSQFETIKTLSSNRFVTESMVQLSNGLFYQITKEYTRL